MVFKFTLLQSKSLSHFPGPFLFNNSSQDFLLTLSEQAGFNGTEGVATTVAAGVATGVTGFAAGVTTGVAAGVTTGVTTGVAAGVTTGVTTGVSG